MKKLFFLFVFALVGMAGANAQGCLPEGITFTTQEQIDNFQTNYPGCTEIEGDVAISGYDITNLNGLNVLTSIGGTLQIGNGGWGNIVLTNLTGLENLVSIGGDLHIGGHMGSGWGWTPLNPVLNSLTGLDNLTSIGANLWIIYNPALTNLIGLESLTSISGGIFIQDNSNLTSCSIQNICDYLINPNGIVDIYNNGSGCKSQNELADDCWGSIPCLPFGNYNFISQTDIDSFKTVFPGCNELEGNVKINSNTISNLAGLNEVYSVGGDVDLRSCDSLSSLTGLENLSSIGGNLNVYYNNFLPDLFGLNNLNSIGGSLAIHENNKLISLTGLENLDSIGGWLGIGTIYTVGDPPPPGGNILLTSISSLSNLTYVGVGIDIGGNHSLLSLNGLENIDESTISYLQIGSNYSLSTCEVQSVCDYLADPNGYIYIYGNAPGCNSVEEVEEACVTGNQEIISESGIKIIPNPSKDKITLSLPALTGKTVLSIFNLSGEKLLEKQLSSKETTLNISALLPGVYVVRVQDEKKIETKQFIKQ